MSLCAIHHSCAKHSYIYLNVLWLSFFLCGFKTFTVFDYQRTRLTLIFWDFLEITEGSEGDVGKQRSRKWRQLARKIGQNQLPLFVLNIHTLKATHELLKRKKKEKEKVGGRLSTGSDLQFKHFMSCCLPTNSESEKHLEWQQQRGFRQLHSCSHQEWRHDDMKGLCHVVDTFIQST